MLIGIKLFDNYFIKGVMQMPKMIPITKKREWLNRYEQGNSEASIAKGEHRDLNVIKRGIRDAKNERNLSVAQAGLLKDALRKHQDSLLAVLKNMLSAIMVPPTTLELPKRFSPEGKPIILPFAQITYNNQKGLVLSLTDEDTINWQLLREHLKGERLWGKVEKWKKAILGNVKARIALRLKTETLLESNTTYRVIDVIDNTSSANYLYSAAVELFCRMAMEEAIQIPDREVFVRDLIVIAEPYIKYTKGDKPLAHYADLAKQFRSSIINSYDSLIKYTKVTKMKENYENLCDITKKTKDYIEEIVLLGIIPGHCRVCQRLGL
jgi:hypothetical protein